mgnify:CR=1 FL=1
MNAWKEERNLRIRYEERSSIKAFDINVYEFHECGKIKIKDLNILFKKINKDD